MYAKMSDAELLQLLKAGAPAGLSEICRRYTRFVFAYCHRYSRCVFDTENLVQDTFIGLWNYRARLDAEGSLEGLLIAIARRKCIDLVRTRLNSPVYEDYVNYRDSVVADNSNPLEYEEYMAAVRDSIKRLPGLQREVIELSRIHDCSNTEIADRLGISEKTVRNRLSLGLKELRARLEFISLMCVAYFVNYFDF